MVAGGKVCENWINFIVGHAYLFHSPCFLFNLRHVKLLIQKFKMDTILNFTVPLFFFKVHGAQLDLHFKFHENPVVFKGLCMQDFVIFCKILKKTISKYIFFAYLTFLI